MWKVIIAFLVIGALGTGLMILISYNQMTYQASVRPWEDPMLQPPEGSVPVNADDDLLYNREEAATALTNPIPLDDDSFKRGRRAYRQYCLTCHGANLDNFGPVGPSLPWKENKERISLDSPQMAEKADGELFWIIRNKVNAHPPIGESMTKREIWDTVNYLRFKQEETARLLE
jgi:mono/diheme cytochrome c family protein